MTPERWLWQGNSPAARLARGALWAPSIAYGLAMRARTRAYRTGLFRTRRVERPVVAVGNLTVGGAGKTPLAAWIAQYYAGRGCAPAVVLRDAGGDEAEVHRREVPGALVVADANRVRAAARAIAGGAMVIVLDDAFQRLDIHRDLNIAVVAAESVEQPERLIPAGPWREPMRALRRADCVVVTRKRATASAAAAVAQRLGALTEHGSVARARLEIGGFEGMLTGERSPTEAIAGRRVLAACGIADPLTFAAQLRGLGAQVELLARRDHHAYTPADARNLLSAGRSVDYVVTTAKDAVKLRRLWPTGGNEPLVARLRIVWEDGRTFMNDAISNVLSSTYS